MNIPDFDYGPYADLLLDAGLGFDEGRNLIIRYHAGGALLARRCAEAAYARGARIVESRPVDPHVLKARIAAQAGNEDALSASPGWTRAWEETIVGEKWAYLALESHEDVGLLADADHTALAIHEKNQQAAMKRFRDAVTSHAIPWCVASVPGPNWAERVLGPGAEAEDLWMILEPILLLDRSDPSAAWAEKAKILEERSKKLDELALDSLRFEDEGTDLTIGLLERSRWKGGPETADGLRTMPNIPTEEVFTTPDRLRVDGTVRVTRPVEIRGTLVEGARFTFEGGLLVDFDAESGRRALEGFAGTDEGSRRLGEVALVGADSPIAASGLNFASILFDENASCHIALGSGYVGCVAGGESLTDDDAKIAAGCNPSLVHRDFMIGSPSTQVTGVGRNGRKTPIMREGRFVI
jgi:aminopeptidase